MGIGRETELASARLSIPELFFLCAEHGSASLIWFGTLVQSVCRVSTIIFAKRVHDARLQLPARSLWSRANDQRPMMQKFYLENGTPSSRLVREVRALKKAEGLRGDVARDSIARTYAYQDWAHLMAARLEFIRMPGRIENCLIQDTGGIEVYYNLDVIREVVREAPDYGGTVMPAFGVLISTSHHGSARRPRLDVEVLTEVGFAARGITPTAMLVPRQHHGLEHVLDASIALNSARPVRLVRLMYDEGLFDLDLASHV